MFAALFCASIGISVVQAEQGQDRVLVQCGSTISLDKRLVMEQWALPGGCERPIRTRVTDRFLGFICLEHSGAFNVCRSYIPGPGSRAFDTAKSFRCVDLGLTDEEHSPAVSRMREWSAEPKQCDWNPYSPVLAMEVDFDNGQVCIAALCMPTRRLSAIGAVRLRRLVTSAFQELNLTAQVGGPQTDYFAHARSR
ncbi:MAG: hypothetical protein HC774_08065 [Sphingomonadales bacterium]|nr:hypothetical protein [Rhodospirillales bacterium]NKB16803.1 hypothetical protein [Sphingomonadales bacterium]